MLCEISKNSRAFGYSEVISIVVNDGRYASIGVELYEPRFFLLVSGGIDDLVTETIVNTL